MTTLKLKLLGVDLDEVVNFLIGKINFDYENHSTNTSILIAENFYFRNMSSQLNMVIFKREEFFILVDVVAGGGGSGLLNIDWWSESSYAATVRRLLSKYAEERNLEITEI